MDYFFLHSSFLINTDDYATCSATGFDLSWKNNILIN